MGDGEDDDSGMDCGSDFGDADEERPIYNPLNLPLGWDGKPIPFWLYKLHGLGIEYKCEDAITLYEKLKRDAEEQTFRPDQDVECEDIQGNVMSQRAFEDLRRQGLV